MSVVPEKITVKNLKVHFAADKGMWPFKKHLVVRAVHGVDLTINKGEILGLVGESGCGKTTLGRAMLKLVHKTAGEIVFEDTNLDSLSKRELNDFRRNFQIIFQNPYSALNPRMTVGNFVAEPIRKFLSTGKQATQERVYELFSKVGLRAEHAGRYPHEFSGGQQQRLGIARALASGASFIVADEPVSALDVSVQAQIINLLRDLKNELDLTLLFISHDLTTVRYFADRICVMYLGTIVEEGRAEEVFDHPKHPYTKALISANPIADPKIAANKKPFELPGEPPSPIVHRNALEFTGCPFRGRCQEKIDRCEVEVPQLKSRQGVRVACHLYD